MSEAHQAFALNVTSDGYVYKLARLASESSDERFAAISSDDKLSYFRMVQQSLVLVSSVQAVHAGVTCLQDHGEFGLLKSLVLTAGRDGLVKLWADLADKPFRTLRTARGEPISALACSEDSDVIAAGTDTDSEKTGDVAVYLWHGNQRDEYPTQSFTEVHSNSITAMLFHPYLKNQLFTASTDSLINVLQVDADDEDSAVMSTAMHDAAVHHITTAGQQFDPVAGSTSIDVWAVSHDERASCYKCDSEGLEESCGSKIAIKEHSDSDYTICARPRRGKVDGIWVCVGSNKPETSLEPSVSIAILKNRSGHGPDMTAVCRLPGAHGEEVVRDVWWLPGLLDTSPSEPVPILTAGEDGMIRLWFCDVDAVMKDSSAVRDETLPAKRSKIDRKRYKPY